MELRVAFMEPSVPSHRERFTEEAKVNIKVFPMDLNANKYLRYCLYDSNCVVFVI